MKATIIGSAPQLLVPDVAKATTYYCNILGFSLINHVLDPPVYGMVQRDGFQVHFAKSDVFSINEQHRKETTDFILWIREIDAFYKEVKQKGANIIQDITLRPYGSREFIISDCYGYKILIGD